MRFLRELGAVVACTGKCVLAGLASGMVVCVACGGSGEIGAQVAGIVTGWCFLFGVFAPE